MDDGTSRVSKMRFTEVEYVAIAKAGIWMTGYLKELRKK